MARIAPNPGRFAHAHARPHLAAVGIAYVVRLVAAFQASPLTIAPPSSRILGVGFARRTTSARHSRATCNKTLCHVSGGAGCRQSPISATATANYPGGRLLPSHRSPETGGDPFTTRRDS